MGAAEHLMTFCCLGLPPESAMAAVVPDILAVAGTNDVGLTLVALLALAATLVMTGSTLSGTVMSLMRPSPQI